MKKYTISTIFFNALKAILPGVFVYISIVSATAQTLITNENFLNAIDECLSTNPVDGLCYSCQYGAMPYWDVSAVTQMDSAFYSRGYFNGDISDWDVNNVTDMSMMFYFTSFNKDIGTWDVSNVTDMSYMFYGSQFNQNIGFWDVSNVTDMSGMFYFNFPFNQDIGSWDVGNVANMSWMFFWSVNFNQDISSWDVGEVTNMQGMFACASVFNQDISSWNLNGVTDMSYMFQSSYLFNQDIGSWDVNSVTDMTKMFYYASSFNQDITSWCVEKIPTEPDSFSENCPLLPEYQPYWGEPCDTTVIIDDIRSINIHVFPNPALNEIFIETNGDLNGNKLFIELYDETGILVMVQEECSSVEQIKIDVSTIKPGLYFIYIYTNNKALSIGKVIIK